MFAMFEGKQEASSLGQSEQKKRIRRRIRIRGSRKAGQELWGSLRALAFILSEVSNC